MLLAAIAAALFGGAGLARAADFELAMVIKETTNPYYNATLQGAQIAASEIGGTAKNYGPTQSSAAGADRRSSTTSPTATSPRSRSRRATRTPSCRR